MASSSGLSYLRHDADPAVAPMLQTARARAGLGLRAAARATGISCSYLRYLELGERCPSSVVAAELTRALCLTEAEAELLARAAVPDRGRSHPLRRRTAA